VTPEEVSLAAWKGAWTTALPALALATPIPFLWQKLFWGSVRALRAYMPYSLAKNLMGTLVWFLPALLAVPVGWFVARKIRQEAAFHPSRGRAVAAGACIGATLACTLVIVGKNLVIFEPGWIGLQIMGAALGVGVLGAISFGAAGPNPGEQGKIPALYQGLTTTGLTGPIFFLAAVLWGFLGLAFPGISLKSILLAIGLPSLIGSSSIASLLLILPLLTPVAYLSGRLTRYLFPDASPNVLRIGLVLPALVLLSYITFPWLFSAHRSLTLSQAVGLSVAWVLGLGCHGIAAWLALPSGEEQAALPQKTAPELPA
jgi:hypothetical protein